jgi:cytoskeletal protein CcmA (bactofilin family)
MSVMVPQDKARIKRGFIEGTMMIYVVFLTVIFLMMMLSLLLMSLYSIQRDGGGALGIRKENARDPRYFSTAFSRMIEKALQNYDGQGSVRLSKEEALSFAENLPSHADRWETLVVARQPFQSNGIGFFSKEIYAYEDAVMEQGCGMRAIASEKRLLLEQGCRVVRWADAEAGIYAKRDCDLGISATSGDSITLDIGCRFNRLFAPEIRVRPDAQEEATEHSLGRLFVSGQETKRNQTIRYGLKTVGAGTKQICSMVTQSNLLIGKDAHIYGDVKSNKNIRIQSGVVITGNVFADQNIVIEQGVYIGGVVFTQESLFVGAHSEIGRYGVTKSLVAREEIVLCEGATVHGYIHCERGGRTVDWETFRELIRKHCQWSGKRPYTKSADIPSESGSEGPVPPSSAGKRTTHDGTSVSIRSTAKIKLAPPSWTTRAEGNLFVSHASMLAPLGDSGFRGNTKLTSITLPSDLITIGRSYFYRCTNLRTVTIPASVRVIEDYAFCDCESLEAIIFSPNSQLERIGDYAFDGCAALTCVIVPARVRRVGVGAFRSCHGLTSITMDYAEQLASIGGHAFQHCGALEQIHLPPNLGTIEHCLFYGCTALTEVRIPQTVKTVKDYAFFGCTNLKLFMLESVDTALLPSAFDNTDQAMLTMLGDGRRFLFINDHAHVSGKGDGEAHAGNPYRAESAPVLTAADRVARRRAERRGRRRFAAR